MLIRPRHLRVSFVVFLFLIAGAAQARTAFRVVSNTLPQFMRAGETREIALVLKNDGDTAWRGRDGAVLVAGERNSPRRVRAAMRDDETVMPGARRRFAFTYEAPTTPGTYAIEARLVIGGESLIVGAETLRVLAPNATCPDIPHQQVSLAQAIDKDPADDAIQCRFELDPDPVTHIVNVDLPTGIIVLRKGLRLAKKDTHITGKGVAKENPFPPNGLLPTASTLVASPALVGVRMLDMNDMDGCQVDNVHFYANREARSFLTECFNANPDTPSTIGGTSNGLVFTNSRIDLTQCGSSLETNEAQGVTVKNNIVNSGGFGAFESPGADDRNNHHPWADGMGIGNAVPWGTKACEVSGNIIVDATDIGLAIFKRGDCIVSNNTILSLTRYAFEGIGESKEVDSGTLHIESNHIIGNPGKLGVALAVGGAAWQCDYGPVDGGAAHPDVVKDNVTWGGQIGVGVEEVKNLRVLNNSASRALPSQSDPFINSIPAEFRQDIVYGGSEPDATFKGSYLRDQDYEADFKGANQFNVEIVGPDPNVTWVDTMGVCVNQVPPNQPPPGQDGPPLPDCLYTFDPAPVSGTITLVAPQEGGLLTIAATHSPNCGWRIKNDDANLWTRPDAAGSGLNWPNENASNAMILAIVPGGIIKFTVDPIISGGTRSAHFPVLRSNGYLAAIDIRQCGPATISAAAQSGVVSAGQGNLSYAAPANGASVTINVTPAGCIAPPTVSDSTWIKTVIDEAAGTMLLTVLPNSGAARSGTVAVASHTITINQFAHCPATISPSTYAAPNTASVVDIAVTAECTWTTNIPADTPFLHVVQATDSHGATILPNGSGVVIVTGNATVRIAVDANSGAARAGSVTIGDSPFIVNQKASNGTAPGCPTIQAQPVGTTTVLEPQHLVLNVYAAPADAQYQWYDGGSPLPNQTSPELILTPSDAAYPQVPLGQPPLQKIYRVDVTSSGCTIASNTVIVTYVAGNSEVTISSDPPKIVNSTAGTLLPAFQVGVLDTNPGLYGITYQWYRGTTPDQSRPIPGATSSSLQVQASNDSYWCAVFVENPRRFTLTLYSGTTRVIVPGSNRHRAVRHDFNSDGHSDLAWQNRTTGELRVWTMNGTQHLGTINYAAVPAGQRVESLGDLSGVGIPAFILRNQSTGENASVIPFGTSLVTTALDPQPDGNWFIGAVADMDNDGHDDIVWFNTSTREVRIWFMSGTTHIGSWSIGFTTTNDWRLQGAADLNADGKPDLVFRNFATGENVAWLMDDVVVASTMPLPTSARRPKTAPNAIDGMPGAALDSFSGAAWRMGSIDDVNGDGKPDIWWFNAQTGATQLWTMFLTTRASTSTGETEPDHDWQLVGDDAGAPDILPVTPTSLSVSAPAVPFGSAATIAATLTTGAGGVANEVVTFTLDGAGAGNAATDANGRATITIPRGIAAGTHAIGAAFAGDSQYGASTATASLVVTPATPVLSWTQPASAVYGTPLDSHQLDATANVPGTFAYQPPSGTVLDAGTHTLTAVFTPQDTTNYTTASVSTSFVVLKKTPVITWPAPASIAYGTALSTTQLDATADVAGTFTYTPAAGTVLGVGQQSLSTHFVPADPNNVAEATAQVTLTVSPAALTIRVNDATKQYSDPLPSFSLTYSGFVLGQTPSVLSGTAAIATDATPLSGPGNYAVAASGLTSTNYAITFIPGTLVVTPEDARISYDGTHLVAAGGSAPEVATFELAAIVYDISATADANGDAAPGDIRNAQVTFVDRASGATLCVASVVLADANDLRIGIASCLATVDFTGRSSLTAGSVVGGWYIRDSATDDAVISVAAQTGAFQTGGGTIVVTQTVGTLGADANTRVQFTSNTRGRSASVVFTHGGRTYRAKLASILNAAVSATPGGGIADVTGIATLADITGTEVVIDNAAVLHLRLVDAGEPGSNDVVSITLRKGTGGLWLNAGPQKLSGGDIQVHDH